MNIKSNSNNQTKKFNVDMNLVKSQYFKIGVFTSSITLIIAIFPIVDIFTILTIFFITFVVALIWIFIYIDDYNSNTTFSFIKLSAIIIIFLLITSNKLMFPLIDAYNKNEVVNVVLPLDENITVYYNDKNTLFIIFVKEHKQPLVLTMEKQGTYYKMKSQLLDKKIKLEKKRIKEWYDTDVEIGYYLDDSKFN